MAKETKEERIKRYMAEGRGDWWYWSWWKQILYVILFPLIMSWMAITWCIMKLGRGIFMLGDLISGQRWNGGNWSEDV